MTAPENEADMRTMTVKEQRARFGMTRDEAMTIRDRALALLSPDTIAASRTAWLDVVSELRDPATGQMRTNLHPEFLRFSMIQKLTDGATIAEAVDHVRQLSTLP